MEEEGEEEDAAAADAEEEEEDGIVVEADISLNLSTNPSSVRYSETPPFPPPFISPSMMNLDGDAALLFDDDSGVNSDEIDADAVTGIVVVEVVRAALEEAPARACLAERGVPKAEDADDDDDSAAEDDDDIRSSLFLRSRSSMTCVAET